MTPILECRNLTKVYKNHKIALDQVNISLNRGRIVGLLGPNGSGKSTLIKLAAGLLTATEGEILIDGQKPGKQTKAVVSYLPDRTYFHDFHRVCDLILFFKEFYSDFNAERAYRLLSDLGIQPSDRLKAMSKGTKEKMELILTMSRDASLYLLDEPIGGVDPAARDYILNTIISNYNPDAAVIISTHLIQDVESVLDDVIFIKDGHLILYDSAAHLRETERTTIDGLFREVFKC